MIRTIFSALFLTITMVGEAQHDSSLGNRLNAVLQFTQVLDFDKVMDYTYPRLFTIAPREALLEAMNNSFDTDEFTIELDSLKVDTIFPVFSINNASYAKIKHTIMMKMKYKEKLDSTDGESTDFMVMLMEQQFGEGRVRFDSVSNSFDVSMLSVLVAIKDNLSPKWTFVNLDEDKPEILSLLFSKEVLTKLKEFE